ncbi:CpsB/CapC family capsule biosynthesis tyrosine phosphatase [uncultured Clostridium sp.]|uniref:CpsB/CapC family capsule biosynthesis tyrosine phosphatase n=1 Tax=uncultured Clostridium sp. TaxID=59620 RepID=UPI002586E480|nr:CpsB/CapC family capsule biosynthesis tyrosine phosphatase [uncultured Clostridium sp.]
MYINLILKNLIIEDKFNVTNLLEKIEDAGSVGVKRLVIAPCYYDEESRSSIEEVKEIVEDLNLYLKEKKADIKLYAGNLVRDNYDNVKEFIDGKIGSINDSKYVLLNTEESADLEELMDIIYEFNLKNYIPIIVAPEKIKEIIHNYKNIKKLQDEGCLFQLDLGSINGEYGKDILKTAKMLKKKDVYSFIGFENNIKKKYVNKDLESISKKGLSILMKNGEVNNKSTIKKKKIGSFMNF